MSNGSLFVLRPRNPLFAFSFFFFSRCRQGDRANGPAISGVRRTGFLEEYLSYPLVFAPHLAALGTFSCAIPGGWVQLPREAAKPGHMTVESRFLALRPCLSGLHIPMSNASSQARFCSGRVLACCRHPWLRCFLYNRHSAHQNTLFFSHESTPGNKIDNPSISTTHSRQNQMRLVSTDEILTIITIRTATEDVQSKR